MGFCFSCCRGDAADDDHKPLLPQHYGDSRLPSYTNPLPPPRTQPDKIADIIAALYAGKLPSQEQVNRALRHALSSELLSSHHKPADGRALGRVEEEELNEVGMQVMDCVRAAVQAALEFGMEKNGESSMSAASEQTLSKPVQMTTGFKTWCSSYGKSQLRLYMQMWQLRLHSRAMSTLTQSVSSSCHSLLQTYTDYRTICVYNTRTSFTAGDHF